MAFLIEEFVLTLAPDPPTRRRCCGFCCCNRRHSFETASGLSITFSFPTAEQSRPNGAPRLPVPSALLPGGGGGGGGGQAWVCEGGGGALTIKWIVKKDSSTLLSVCHDILILSLSLSYRSLSPAICLRLWNQYSLPPSLPFSLLSIHPATRSPA